MLLIEGGRNALYQWDLNQRIILKYIKAGLEVHFFHEKLTKESCPILLSYEEDGQVFVDIPNFMLQESGIITIYIYVKNENKAYTDYKSELLVIAREKPSDYVYTETEIKSWEKLENELNNLNERFEKLPKVPEKLSELEDDITGYDVIIKSQEEWQKLIDIEKWGGAKSVLIAADITCDHNSKTILIPSNVLYIDGKGHAFNLYRNTIEAEGSNTLIRNFNFNLIEANIHNINGMFTCSFNIQSSVDIKNCNNIIGCTFSRVVGPGINGTLTLENCDTIILDSHAYELFDEVWYIKNCTNIINSNYANVYPGETYKSVKLGYEHNTAYSGGSVVGGLGNVAGIKGYYIEAINFSERKILLDVNTNYLTNHKKPIVTTEPILPTISEDIKYSVGKYIGIINKNHYVFLTTIEAIQGNVITYSGSQYSIGFDSFVANLTERDEYIFFVPEQPGVGVVAFSQNCFAFGENAIAASCALSAGQNTIAYDYGLATGRNTIAGFGGTAEGIDTQALAIYSHTEGVGTRAKGRVQHVQGKYNVIDENNEFAHIVGNGTDDKNRSNAHTLDWKGNAWFAGKIYNSFADVYIPFDVKPAYYVNHGSSGIVFVYENNDDFPGFTKGDNILITLDGVKYLCKINGVWDESEPGRFGVSGQYGIRININNDNSVLLPENSALYTTYAIKGTKLEMADFYNIESKPSLDLMGGMLTNMGIPMFDGDVVNKKYVDNIKAELIKKIEDLAK